MEKVYINGRDELFVLDLSKVACFKADDDYTTVCYISGMKASLSMGLSKVERAIAVVPPSPRCNFVRLGRSYIVNQAYLYQIQVLKQRLTLSDGTKVISLAVSKDALKRYKQHIVNKVVRPKTAEPNQDD